ncbi:MAG: hypothetical protein EOO05_22215 [Chitinophagaceae bacterium]|nr:MAG: hypothetical protein EOO05_22215 [Chitinophagaceae bacterium]
MDILQLPEAISVFGKQVTTFPNGIKAAYDSLVDKLPGGFEGRPYYGLSKMENSQVLYYATAKEMETGEAERYGETRFSIPEGAYLAQTIWQWHDKTGSVANVFHELMQDVRVEPGSWCVEWYKSDEELVCMMRLRPGQGG